MTAIDGTRQLLTDSDVDTLCWQFLNSVNVDAVYADWAMRITHSHFDTGDPLQDTTASTYPTCSSLLAGSNVGAWLSLILTNTYFDDYRRKQRRPLEYPTDAFIDHQLAAVKPTLSHRNTPGRGSSPQGLAASRCQDRYAGPTGRRCRSARVLLQWGNGCAQSSGQEASQRRSKEIKRPWPAQQWAFPTEQRHAMKLSEPAKSIVGCIDGSTAAINAAQWAVDEAISRDIPLRLVQVVGADDGSSTAGADDHLETQYAETAMHAACSAVQRSGSRSRSIP